MKDNTETISGIKTDRVGSLFYRLICINVVFPFLRGKYLILQGEQS